MIQYLRFVIDNNPGWSVILLGVFGLSVSTVVWSFEHFERLSVKVLCASGVILLLGIILTVLAEGGKLLKEKWEEKMEKERRHSK